MGNTAVSQKNRKSSTYIFQENVLVRIFKTITRRVVWTKFVRVFCGVVALILLALFITKLIEPDLLPDLKLEIILLSLAVTILLPFITSIEALGIKVGVKEQVQELSAWAKATPYYTLASQFEEEDDYDLAEKYYQLSLDECADFWPAIFGLGVIYQNIGKREKDTHYFSKSIDCYKKVLDLDKQNIYTYNNLAAIYLDAPPPLFSPEKALECADKALEIMPVFANALYYKAQALNSKMQPDYKEAIRTIEAITNPERLKNVWHWVMLEQAIANSHLGKHVTVEFLENMYQHADEEDDAGRLLEDMEKDLPKFDPVDNEVVKKFIVTKKDISKS